MWHVWGTVLVHNRFGGGDLRERDYLEDQDLGRSIITRWIFRKCDREAMDWIDLSQDRNIWSELVNAIMNFRIP